MLVKEPPTIHRFESFDEERDVVCGIRFAAIDGGLVDWLPEGGQCVQARRGEWADILP